MKVELSSLVPSVGTVLKGGLSVCSSSGQPDRVLIISSRGLISPSVFMTLEARELDVSVRLCVLTVVLPLWKVI